MTEEYRWQRNTEKSPRKKKKYILKLLMQTFTQATEKLT
jgi:hypothetical protein